VDADAKLVRVVSISQAAEGARIAGASRIIGVDLNSNRFNEGERSIY
jgi:alcohol dehydrogenase/alcohol dehydrogenase class-P